MDLVLVLVTLSAISPADGLPNFIGGHSVISLWQKKVEKVRPGVPSFDFQKKLAEELAKVSLENSLEEVTSERTRAEEEARLAKVEAEKSKQTQSITYYAPVIRYGQPTYFVPSAVPTAYSSPAYSAPSYAPAMASPGGMAPGGAGCVGGS